MNSRTKMSWLAAAAAAAAVAVPALAHHSFAMFDQAKIVTLDGTVTEFQWTNPHAFIEMDIVTNGKKSHWSVELNSPNNLKRQGWKRTSLKPGDKAKVRINPLRNGRPGGLFLDLEMPDGTVLDSGMRKDGKPVNVPQV